MKHYLGIDIGSTTSSVVVLDKNGGLVYKNYNFHAGQIVDTLLNQLASVDLQSVEGIGYTSSCPDIFKTGLKSDSRVSFITASKYYYPESEALLIIGGEKFGLVRFGKKGEYLNFRSNTSCAAGTGSFLDQQLSRLNLKSIAQLGSMASGNVGIFPKIASRCSVFAKTDLIHAQQEGYSLAEICDGLCYGLAKNVIDAVFDETEIKRLVVAGGVSLNAGVMKHLQQLTGAELVIDENSHIYGAIGAALIIMETGSAESQTIHTSGDIISFTEKKKSYFNPPLELMLSEYPDFSGLEEYNFISPGHPEMSHVEVVIYQEITKKEKTKVFLGIDIGSTSTKAVLLDKGKQVLAGFYTRTAGRPVIAVQIVFEAIDQLQANKLHHFEFAGAGTTGSGRKLIGRIINADAVPDEITAHARAAVELDPETDTIIEIGGQDSKFTLLHHGIVTLSIMNNVCAAGTGSFIEEQANKLNCPLSDYAERASREPSPMTSNRCTVFMERDLNQYLHEGYEKDELLASVLHSIRDNYLTKVTGKAKIGNKIFFQGATAKNKALVAAFEQKLGKPIMVSKFCHLTGALGVALELHDIQPASSEFRGIELWKQEIPVRSEVCELCTNHCKLRIAEIGIETVAYGFLCGRDYETGKFVKNELESFDLLQMHKKIFSFPRKTKSSQVTIGLPATLHLVEELSLWQKFFDLMGIKTVTSEKYTSAVRDGKKIAEAEFCAPVSAAYGHVHYLLDKVDYIFLPVYLETGGKQASSKLYCYYTQYISSMIASTKSFRDTSRLLMPMVRSLKPESHMVSELTGMLQAISGHEINKKAVKAAYLEASSFYAMQIRQWKNLFLKDLDTERLNIMLLGRPYTVLSRTMNNNIPEIIANNGYNAFFMNMLPEKSLSGEEHTELLKTITWNYAADILKSAEQVALSKNLYPILITSFKCTPDSFVIEYFREILDTYKKPYLILQLDEHDSAVGYETRIEAAIRSFKNHFEAGKKDKGLKPSIEKPSLFLQYDTSKEKPEDVRDIFQEHDLDQADFQKQYSGKGEEFDLSLLKAGDTSKLEGKTILIPGWDLFTSKLLEAMFIADGRNAHVISDTPGSIQRSLNLNTGQCLPLNVITQNAYEYIIENSLDPASTTVWVPRGYLACNLPMFPHYMLKLLRKYDKTMSEVTVYPGNAAFYDFSVKMGVNAYLVYLFSGNIRKVACKIRPYEIEKGACDRVLEKSLEILYEAFKNQQPKEPAIKEIIELFDQVAFTPVARPKVAIFGDMYARDNDVFNEGLIKVIEDNGGEALCTSYSEYLRIILKQTELRLFHEGRYLEHYNLRFLKYLIPLLEGKYSRYFEKYIKNIKPLNGELFDILDKHHLHLLHRGEAVDNILKIENLVRSYDDISLFVQTNPAYCCPSMVTEAMSSKIEQMTGIPVVSIEYDGTIGAKNDAIIPYLKLRDIK